MATQEFTNRLIHETSPYLLQHAHNPVDWYPWGEEAFAKAKAENKPVLLSVGYSACHWCHVMAHESFENPKIAGMMNDLFINIKVDREERPDIDSIYMEAVTALTGRGGWPMTVFLTPEGLPYYGGTYFPPDRRYGNTPSFPEVLKALSEAYHNSPEEVAQQVGVIKEQLYNGVKVPAQGGGGFDTDMLDAAASRLNSQFDPTHGGLGNAPKFPQASALSFALCSALRTGNEYILNNVILTLDKMAKGGIYDHLGGGFARYSTDQYWLVPHFEKMLYDNAQLSLIYIEAFQATGNEFYRFVAEDVLNYVLREMTYPEGGFYSTQDADSEGVEGKFFVWSKAEIEEALGQAAPAFIRYYGVSAGGNFEGHNILNVKDGLETVAAELEMTVEELEASLNRSSQKLFKIREQRVHSGRDEKILTAWNGMMLKSFAVAARVLDNATFRQAAINNAEFILKYLRQDGRLLRTFKDDEKGKQARLNGYLEDYSCFADGLLALYEATFDLRWLNEATSLADAMLDRFWEPAIKGFYDTSTDHEQLVTRPRTIMDNATPAGNSVALDVLYRLGLLTGEDRYREAALAGLESLAGVAGQYPQAFGRVLSAMDFALGAPKEIVIVGDETEPATQALLQTVYGAYLPYKVVMLYPGSLTEKEAEKWPLLTGRIRVKGLPTAYVCENYACQLPVNSPDDLARQLGLS